MNTTIRLFVAMLMATIFLFCTSDIKPESGEELAKSYCASCHVFPKPELLDHNSWKQYVLPRMAAFMGIYSEEHQRDSLIEKGPGGERVKAKNIYPEKAILSEEDWTAIESYYLNTAPRQWKQITKRSESTNLFKVNYPDLFLSPPSTTFVQLDEGIINFSDANKGIFLQLDQKLAVKNQGRVGEGLVDLFETKQDYWMTIMGSFSPTDDPQGYILQISKSKAKAKKVIDKLQRPVHAEYADLDQDGYMDILISEFGKWTGSLSLYLNKQKGDYEKKILLDRSGTIRTELLDYNQDGLQDILALFGQGDEGIVLFKNKGQGNFEQESILRFHPSMGSSYFDLYDFNQDGKEDIIYVAGDNADYPPILKPYHGIYIYEQKENFQFSQTQFLHLPGAYKAIPKDFDQDGDIDIAAISFFPDYTFDQDQSFIFFEKTAEGYFPKNLSLNNAGRWITMDAGDYDSDGDEDLILGSLTFEVLEKPELVNQWVKNGLPFIILENQAKK